MASFEPFGQVAIRLGFVTSAQIESALDIQKSLERSGRGRKLLGMILLETGLISSADLIEILQYYEQQRALAAKESDDKSQSS
jgi:hypothetical protein